MKIKLFGFEIIVRPVQRGLPGQDSPRMTEEELIKALGMSAENPLIRALRQLFEDQYLDTVQLMSGIELAGKPAITHLAGGLEMLLSLGGRIEQLRLEGTTREKVKR